ncbi:unnamed protein product [Darwinula stevensoni]|uniref:Tumor suppressor candidate 2 n=1 Tax=Darwinula stevensoni TaxID=69355 RepID=A0A7R8ZYT8_9CRUS|nr:unnamed protein product [Darwinula stevensoni]CAG0881206.1 unnamed protein product [Darwinula stevensoni]
MGSLSSKFTSSSHSKAVGRPQPNTIDLWRSTKATPFVYSRRGSMFFDEDGDMAHEFYIEELHRGRRRAHMKRITVNLTPQGEVKLPIPRINVDFPVILFQP